MKFMSYAVAAAAAASITLVASAQAPTQSSPGQQPPPSPSQPATQSPGQPGPSPARAPTPPATSPDQQVTVVGCIQREADYRRKQDAGKGGVAGTGVGAGNEFVLINASMSTSGPGAASSTSGATGTTYELTGSGEGQASSHVGKRVEITGKLKAAATGAAGNPTGGPTAGEPPLGVDVGGKDLKLRELDVTSIKESSGTCPTS